MHRGGTLIVVCLPSSFSFALAGASQLMLLLSGMYLPQASVASAVHRLLPWEPFPVRSSGHLTHRSYLYLGSTSPVASPRKHLHPGSTCTQERSLEESALRSVRCGCFSRRQGAAVSHPPTSLGTPCRLHLLRRTDYESDSSPPPGNLRASASQLLLFFFT